MRKILLTADDFGRCPRVNAAVEEWYRAGALHQAGLMVNEASVEEACAIAQRNPGLKIGLHLTLCDGAASDGNLLPASPFQAGMLYAFSPSRRAWLKREIAAQFAKFTALGFSPTYWDGHTHLHLHPVVLSLTMPVAVQHGFHVTRLVREPGSFGILPWIFNLLSRRAMAPLQKNNIGFADAVFGLRKSGRMDTMEFQRAFQNAPSGITEIYFHPGAEKQLPTPAWVAEQIPNGMLKH